MLTFNLTLTPATLHKLTKSLNKLATTVTYRPGTPGELSIEPADPANKPAIVAMVDSHTEIKDLPSWADLMREAERLAASQKRQAMQTRRRRGVRVERVVGI